jgi:molybdopterin converting factor subunit 1
MIIKVLFFASLRDYAGTGTMEVEIPAGTSVGELKVLLVQRFPRMAPAQKSTMVAINREYAADEQIIPPEAEVALFPPVSGG